MNSGWQLSKFSLATKLLFLFTQWMWSFSRHNAFLHRSLRPAGRTDGVTWVLSELRTQSAHYWLVWTELLPPAWSLQHLVALHHRGPQVLVKLNGKKRTKTVIGERRSSLALTGVSNCPLKQPIVPREMGWGGGTACLEWTWDGFWVVFMSPDGILTTIYTAEATGWWKNPFLR